MTSNHLLLYRLAELMLEHEQHILSVDLLFDDEQIGDMVKSIQIDSPYQQMLLEGVLTESVNDEKLYVSFTVEGYFHFVLGEVIFNQSEGKSAESLMHIVEENKLNGVKEGVEQCLIRDVQKEDLTRLMWLIDRIDKNLLDLRLLLIPIKTAINIYGVENSLQKLFHEKSENDWEIINHFFLDIFFKPDILNDIGLFVLTLEPFDTNIAQKVFGRAILSIENKKIQFELINKYKKYINYKDGILLSFDDLDKVSILAKFFENTRQYELWLACTNDCINFEIIHYDQSHYFIANSYNSKGLIYLSDQYKKYEEAIDCFYKAYHIRKEFYPSDIFELSTLEHNLGLAFLYKEDLDQANYLLQSALNKRKQINGIYSIPYAITLLLFAHVFKEQEDYVNAEMSFNKAIDIIRRLNPKDYWTIGNTLNNLGQMLYEIDKYDQSISVFLESISNLEKAFLNNHYDLSRVFYNLGKSYFALENHNEALSCFFNSLKIAEEFFKENLPSEISVLFSSISDVYYSKENFEKALEYQQKVLDIELNTLGEGHPDVATSYNNIASIYFNMGVFSNALEFYQKCLTIRLSLPDINYLILFTTYNNIGLVFKNIADFEKAVEFYRKSLDIALCISDFDASEICNQYFNIGECLQTYGMYEEAISNYNKGFKIQQKGGFPYRIAECYAALGNQSEALNYFVQAAAIRMEKLGIEDENTQAAIQKSKSLALEIDQYEKLPDWIKGLKI